MVRSLSRRRFLAIAASGVMVSGQAGAATAFWRGTALGAVATITLGGTGRARADDTIAAVEAELARLEGIFSLHNRASALSRLNRDGYLDAPPRDLLVVLNHCRSLNAATNGAFDPTIQPLWRVLAGAGPGHFPSPKALHAARRLVGWENVEITSSRIVLGRAGMAITLNGIAQGYITDRIAALLRGRGFADVLIDMGEIAALGQRHEFPWAAEIALPDGRIVRRLTLRDRCLAVSAPLGTRLGGSGHILDPRPNAAPPDRQLVAVSADRAVVADGLSTGCCLLTAFETQAAIAKFADARLEAVI